MEPKKTQFYFLIAILTGALILSFFIIKPFLYALILAVIFAVVFQPIQRRMLSFAGGHAGLASFLTILVVVIFVLTPLTFLGMQVFQEAQQLYAYLAQGGASRAFGAFNDVTANLQASIPGMQSLSVDLDMYLRRGLELVLNNIGGFFSSIVKLLGNLFVFLLVLYYVLKEGPKLKKSIIAISPLADTDDEEISSKLEIAISSVIKGNLTIAVIQGVLAAIGFTIFGVPHPVLWGTLAAIAALIPSIGTALVVFPAILFLFFAGETWAAIGLLVWGVVVVGLIDNLLGPRLVSRGLHLHPMLILLSVLGGLSFFGPVGFLLGPLTLSLVFALAGIYSSFSKRGQNQL